MAEIGYGIAYRVLDAQFFGVPQRRRRVFVVGYLGDWRPATAVLLEPTSVFGNTPKGRKTRKGITASAETNPRKAVPYDLYQITAPINRQNREVGDPCHTLAKDNAAHASIVEIKESSKSFVRQTENTMRVRRLTPVECERLQGFPDNWTQIPYGKRPKEQCPDGHRYKALGNSMAVPVMRWIGRRIALFESLKA
jgi:DNA (cytosine-5)-methyltransferase 1